MLPICLSNCVHLVPLGIRGLIYWYWSRVFDDYVLLTCKAPDPRWRFKININFHFHTLLGYHKEVFWRTLKPFWGDTKKYQKKLWKVSFRNINALRANFLSFQVLFWAPYGGKLNTMANNFLTIDFKTFVLIRLSISRKKLSNSM